LSKAAKAAHHVESRAAIASSLLLFDDELYAAILGAGFFGGAVDEWFVGAVTVGGAA